MKIKPIITNHLYTKHTSFEVDLLLENNITFISGESGTGKSALYSFIEELAAEDKTIKCFNYLDFKLLLSMDEIYELKSETINEVTALSLQKSF